MEFRATTTGGDDLDRLTAQAAKALRGAQRGLGREIAKVARRAILEDVKAKRGGLRFSGMRTRLGAKATVTPGTVLTVNVAAKPAGPWAIVEYGSKPHEIRPRRARVLFFDGVYRMSANHPGTAGHRYWAAAETALDNAVTPVIVDAYDDAMEEVF